MACLGHPLLSDTLYGGSLADSLARQALHACRLAFVHPVTGESMEFHSPAPADLVQAMDALGLRYNHSLQFSANGNTAF
jgi:23S rRNA pseudouridine1911/1915/1917 synthase